MDDPTLGMPAEMFLDMNKQKPKTILEGKFKEMVDKAANEVAEVLSDPLTKELFESFRKHAQGKPLGDFFFHNAKVQKFVRFMEALFGAMAAEALEKSGAAERGEVVKVIEKFTDLFHELFESGLLLGIFLSEIGRAGVITSKKKEDK